MSILIPKRLEKLLKKEPVWLTNVTQLCRNIEGLYESSPEFFPDYTFHGIGHINEVLAHADALIEKKSLSKLTGRDAAFLVSAVILHDAGMFLRPDGVQKLVTGSRRFDRIEHSGDETWEKVWADFVDRTKRCSEEKMHYLFGQNITVEASCISRPDMTDNDKRVIGEFLRQNHGRMAHEIAVYGLPGTVDIDLFDHTGFTLRDRDLIGMLARSHSMAVRDTEDYIRTAFGRGPRPYNTPVFYLMILLRMADALDAGKHRISKFRDTQQKIRVPISAAEWRWNERIDRSICRWDDGEKCRYIFAEPTTSIEYVQLDKWLRGTQAELDLCWSILAEKYPEEYCRLSIHRIRCNIHEPDVQRAMDGRFLTEEVRITANPEVTRLLIAPLYGDDPSYGVRELLQNAVDACVERKYIEQNRGNNGYHGCVTVDVDTKAGIFCIEDNGIGMNKHVLLNYYLSAGASYRSSDEWKREYTSDGKSQVARTGKFGVGFLAAFLLGDSVTVTTRHRDDSLGYAFSFTNKSEPLNVTRVEREVGTTIEIRMKEGVLDKLDTTKLKTSTRFRFPWNDWYAFDDPEVRYFWDSTPLKYKGVTLSREPANNPEWFAVESKSVESYLWHPMLPVSKYDVIRRTFFCNGIRVYCAGSRYDLEEYGLGVLFPRVSLMDPSAMLDVDLARSELRTIPDEDALLEQVYRYHIARLLMTQWETEADYRQNLTLGFCLRPFIPDGSCSFLVTPDGFTLNYASVLLSMDIDEYVIVYYDGAHAVDAVRAVYANLPTHIPASIAVSNDTVSIPVWLEPDMIKDYYFRSPVDFAHSILLHRVGLWSGRVTNCPLSDHATSILIRQDIYDAVGRVGWNDILPIPVCLGQMQLIDLKSGSLQGIDSVMNYLDPKLFPFVVRVAPQRNLRRFSRFNSTDLPFPQLLWKLLGPNESHPDRDMWIPFDMEERRKKYPEAFAELEPFFKYLRRYPHP